MTALAAGKGYLECPSKDSTSAKSLSRPLAFLFWTRLMRPHDYEEHPLSLKKRQDVLEVAIQTGSPSSFSALRTPERMTRTGASLRG